MNKRKITQVVPAVREDIADLKTMRALPTPHVQMIDPFLFLNHHGPQDYSPNNQGLPFGPHPHRGFETVTFILEGDLAHRDSGGHESVMTAGGVQWMTTGSGLVHSETSSEEFKKQGGHLEILQLWINLPSRLKMTKPKYLGLQKEDIPTIKDGNSEIQLVSGEWKGHVGPFKPLENITLMILKIPSQSELDFEVPSQENVFFYVIRGEVVVNDREVSEFHLAKFENKDSSIRIKAKRDALILLGHAMPFNEPVVSYGPFVMNTEAEIHQAIRDYQAGKFN